jgi:hypothetical protein
MAYPGPSDGSLAKHSALEGGHARARRSRLPARTARLPPGSSCKNKKWCAFDKQFALDTYAFMKGDVPKAVRYLKEWYQNY